VIYMPLEVSKALFCRELTICHEEIVCLRPGGTVFQHRGKVHFNKKRNQSRFPA